MSYWNSLPSEQEPDDDVPNRCVPAWRGFSIGLAVMVGLNLCLIALGWQHPIRHETQLFRAKWNLATDSNHSFEWIVVGDSSGTFGVDPDVMSQELSGNSLNLCTFGSMGLVDGVWMVDEYLKTHKPPRGVVVVHAADVWTSELGNPFYQYAAASIEPIHTLAARVAAERPSPSECFHFLRYRNWFPLLTVKDRIQNQIGWSDDAGSQDSPPVELPENGLWKLGAEHADPNWAGTHASDYWKTSNRESGHGLSSDHQRSLMRLVRLADENDFLVFLANGPLAQPVAQSPDFEHRLSGVRRDLRNLAQENQRVFFVLEDWYTLPISQMENANHPTGNAVDEYTSALVAAIKEKRKHPMTDP